MELRGAMPKDLKRSLSIAGHRTSLSLEPEFWEALRKAAAAKGVTVSALVAGIDQSRGERNLSSAVRVWVLEDLLVRR
jgi:predicted DNA-binding ribbon-helix-helix protein